MVLTDIMPSHEVSFSGGKYIGTQDACAGDALLLNDYCCVVLSQNCLVAKVSFERVVSPFVELVVFTIPIIPMTTFRTRFVGVHKVWKYRNVWH